jgi:predicted ribosome-associated RNA-binding protein Tma20
MVIMFISKKELNDLRDRIEDMENTIEQLIELSEVQLGATTEIFSLVLMNEETPVTPAKKKSSKKVEPK